jgi:hypothetical protein
MIIDDTLAEQFFSLSVLDAAEWQLAISQLSEDPIVPSSSSI